MPPPVFGFLRLQQQRRERTSRLGKSLPDMFTPSSDEGIFRLRPGTRNLLALCAEAVKSGAWAQPARSTGRRRSSRPGEVERLHVDFPGQPPPSCRCRTHGLAIRSHVHVDPESFLVRKGHFRETGGMGSLRGRKGGAEGRLKYPAAAGDGRPSSASNFLAITRPDVTASCRLLVIFLAHQW